MALQSQALGDIELTNNANCVGLLRSSLCGLCVLSALKHVHHQHVGDGSAQFHSGNHPKRHFDIIDSLGFNLIIYPIC